LVANLFDPVQVEISNDKLGGGVGCDVADVLAARVSEVGRSIEIIVYEVLDADPIDRTDVVHVRDGGSWLFDLPEVPGQTPAGR